MVRLKDQLQREELEAGLYKKDRWEREAEQVAADEVTFIADKVAADEDLEQELKRNLEQREAPAAQSKEARRSSGDERAMVRMVRSTCRAMSDCMHVGFEF